MGLATRPFSDVGDADESVKEFFGSSSAVAFIKQLQESVKLGTTPPAPPQSPYNNSRHGVSQRAATESVPQHIRLPLHLLPPRSLADHLVDCYFSRVHTLYPFIHKEAFLTLYRWIWESGNGGLDTSASAGLGLGDFAVSSTTFYYGLNIVFAMGCQFSDIVRTEREATSEAFFYRCKRALDVDYLERGDLALVQVLLFMAHYLQSSRTPNRCWHAIGTACRLAQVVGLHSTVGDKHRSFAQKQIRRRVWHGCRMVDLAVSSMLGRPTMTSNRLSVPFPDAVDDRYLSNATPICEQPPGTFSRVEWFVATLKLHELLREIKNTLYDDVSGERTPNSRGQVKVAKVQQIQQITQIDSKLDDFRLSLPGPLNWEAMSPAGCLDPWLREKCLLKARFLCLRVLAYRPVLSQSLDQGQGTEVNRNEQLPDNFQTGTGIYANFTLNCSVLCARSAIDLISLVHQTCSTDLASVWFYSVFYTFTAGLLLILTEFHSSVVKIVTREALDLAWEECRSALDHLKIYSKVAEQCANSLDATRSKCLKLQSGKTAPLSLCVRGLTNSGPNQADQTTSGREAGSISTAALVNEAEAAPYYESFLSNLNLDSISLDWSCFDTES
ncbi:fungal specific transcription factor domain-containing protein [Aspergillus lucknowensis]|uniref:Fungal-specific transcription factor domain-containing protein n=1 Tax=Aspergillus lucknowensis TaxID=176173 RepID=A0ABR4LEW3_9EURO